MIKRKGYFDVGLRCFLIEVRGLRCSWGYVLGLWVHASFFGGSCASALGASYFLLGSCNLGLGASSSLLGSCNSSLGASSYPLGACSSSSDASPPPSGPCTPTAHSISCSLTHFPSNQHKKEADILQVSSLQVSASFLS